jgi:pyrimidine-specific ribonucleoside hydrolase
LLERDPGSAARLGTVLYSGSAPDAADPSWNTARDSAAARRVFAATLRLRSLQFADDQLPRYDAELAAAVCAKPGDAAALLCAFHAAGLPQERVRSGHFRCWDEAVVLQFLFPELLSWAPDGQGRLTPVLDRERTRQRYLDLLAGDLSLQAGHRQPVGLRSFPRDASGLRADVAAIAAEALARHGEEEWHSILLTNELHRHLGIYSILGAKMGIRARELLGAGLDELEVLSLTGDREPLSCLTDGLQVATGATLGRGSIAFGSGPPCAAAVFSAGERSLELALKPEIEARIRTDIQRCIAEHGALTPAYWEAVRALALRYWLEMERAAICTETWPAAQR